MTDFNDNSPVFSQDIYNSEVTEAARVGDSVVQVCHQIERLETRLTIISKNQCCGSLGVISKCVKTENGMGIWGKKIECISVSFVS